MKNFNKFLKNKNTVTILGILLCLIILYVGYTTSINKKTALVDVYYANQTIQPKTLITEDMVSKTRVPGAFIKGTYYKNYNDIVGKYSNYNTMIAAGSIFYSDLLVSEGNLPDAVLYNTNEGERVVSFPVDTVTTYGNSIMPGNIVDVYVKLYDNSGKLVYGEFFDNIEVLGVKDASGKNVFENTEEARVPAYVYFSLPEAKYLLFSSLNYILTNDIEVVLVPNTVKFDAKNPAAVEVTSDYLYDFVLDKIQKIDGQEELYNELLNEMEQKALEDSQKKENNTNTNANE